MVKSLVDILDDVFQVIIVSRLNISVLFLRRAKDTICKVLNIILVFFIFEIHHRSVKNMANTES